MKQAQFSWVEFMAEEPAKLQGRSCKPEPSSSSFSFSFSLLEWPFSL